MNSFSMPTMALPTMPRTALATSGMLPMAAAGPVTVPTMQGMNAGPMPMSAAQASLGAEGVKPPSTIKTILKSALTMTGLGAALGAGATFLPFIPGGPLIGAAIGAGAGALIGIFTGVRKARRQQDELRALMMGSLQPAADPSTLGPALTIQRPSAQRTAKATHATHHKRHVVVVRRGDTLGAIARKHGVSVRALHAANRKVIGANPNMIHIGAQLVIPGTPKH